MEHLELVERLAAARIGATFNQYAESELLRRRLEAYLAEREGVDTILVGEAAGYRGAEHLGRAPVELLAQRPLLQAARISGVAVVHLLVELVARDRDLLGVHDDDEVTGVDMRRELRLALAAERVGDLRREAPKGLALGVDEIPLARDLSGLG